MPKLATWEDIKRLGEQVNRLTAENAGLVKENAELLAELNAERLEVIGEIARKERAMREASDARQRVDELSRYLDRNGL